jgi:PKD repeat protein
LDTIFQGPNSIVTADGEGSSTVVVRTVVPVANFTADHVSGVAPLAVQFADASTHSPTGWAWDFGDGGTSTQQSPAHQYVAAGTYTVKLTSTNLAGANQATKTAYITVTGTPPPPPSGDVVESWPLSEASDQMANVTRNGTQPTTPAINPARTNLIDTMKVLGSGGAAFFDSTHKSLATEDKNPAGRLNDKSFIGAGPWSIQMEVKWDTFPGNATFVYRSSSYQIALATFPRNLTFSSWRARSTAVDSLSNTLALIVGHWYTVKFGYDGAKLFLDITDDQGNLTHAELPVSRRAVVNATPLLIGGGGASGGNEWMRNVTFKRFALDPGASPLSNPVLTSNFETTANRGINGLYYYRPFPLHSWNPTLAASLGNHVWYHSTDHDNTGGVWQGFSTSPTVRPTSWTLVWPGSGTLNGQTYLSMETPHLLYVPGDANGRAFYLYAHAQISRPGVSNSQQTCLRTSADLVTWVDEGIVIPSQVTSPLPTNHTGYCTVYSANELPNITGFHAYHLGFDSEAVTFCSPSSDPKSFSTTANDPEELDTTSRFPAGYDNIDWEANLFSPDGVRVYGIGRGFFPGGRGIAVAEMAQENGQWRQPTGKVWVITTDTDVFPTLGYTQDVRAFYESGKVYMYVLRGFYPSIADERVDLLTMDFTG